MYARTLELPNRTFFLFGPRGTGKTTWLRSLLDPGRGRWFDLLLDRELIRLTRDPQRFTQEVEALPAGAWVVIDEVQRLPALLNRVQDLIARHGARRYRFALTGSSARKLKRGGGNLLPGRAVNRLFFPLTAAELGGDFALDQVVRFGSLPAVWADADTPGERIDLLEAYVQNYLTQEVRAEALVKDLVPFTRFLDVAALANGQVTNISSLARDAGVARPTVQGYFEVLIDTLLGVWLPAWQPRARVKEVQHPKFYFFDTGVVRALTGRLRDSPTEAERGILLETHVLHELRAWMNVSGSGGRLSYWRTTNGTEVDFVWTRASHAVAIEVKWGPRWRAGAQRLRDGPLDVLPVPEFLVKLAAGEILR
jgi:predicted AAA+ superfamily ATPase